MLIFLSYLYYLDKLDSFSPNYNYIQMADERRVFFTFQGHSSDVHSVCWDTNGDYLASVSRESVKVWSIASGECIHELNSNGNMFHSCVFHPSYSSLLVIGGYQVRHYALQLCIISSYYLALLFLLHKSLSLSSVTYNQLVFVLSG